MREWKTVACCSGRRGRSRNAVRAGSEQLAPGARRALLRGGGPLLVPIALVVYRVNERFVLQAEQQEGKEEGCETAVHAFQGAREGEEKSLHEPSSPARVTTDFGKSRLPDRRG